MSDENYNGWTNYETWLLKLNLDNEQSLYLMCQEWFKESYKVTDTSKPDIHQLADSFKEHLEEMFWIEEYNIYKICDTWTYRDWLEIDFIEIVEAYIQELTEANWLQNH